MCCIFTCCGWMIDLVQRAWVFAMSCCISSAVCCFLLTSSMAGVAMGYNYSLAEYIELKETNVSVFLKRGVFDDEVVDEMDWRRAGGGMPGAERSGSETSAPLSVPDFPWGYRKANDEGMFATTEINVPNDLKGHDPDHNRFEGSLMKLTLKPKNAGQDLQMQKIMTGYPQDSMEQLKAVQGLMNRRKMNDNSLSGENKGFMTPIAITSYTGSVPMSGPGTSSTWGVSDELLVIQKLLNDRKEAALAHEDMKKTTRQTPRIPLITGPVPQVLSALGGGPAQARRMMDSGTRPRDPVQMADTLIKDAPKWYFPKSVEAPTIWTPYKGPVTIHNYITHTKLKLESPTPPLSQDSFRRAMQEASINKDQKENEIKNTPINEPTAEPQRDYDEEDVKGIPIRKKRKKRNRRFIIDSPTKVTKQSTRTEATDNASSFGNRNSVYSNLMTVLMNFNLMLAESSNEKLLPKSKSSETLPKSLRDISSTDSGTPSYINAGTSLTEALRTMRIIKSTIAF